MIREWREDVMQDNPYRLRAGELVIEDGGALGHPMRGVAVLHDGNRVLMHGEEGAVLRLAERLESGRESVPAGLDPARIELFQVPWCRIGFLGPEDVRSLGEAVTRPGALYGLRRIVGAQWRTLSIPAPVQEPGP